MATAVHVSHQECLPRGGIKDTHTQNLGWIRRAGFRIRPGPQCKLLAFFHPQHLYRLSGLMWQAFGLAFTGFAVGQT